MLEVVVERVGVGQHLHRHQAGGADGAAQVAAVVKPLAQARNLFVASFYGGTSIGKDRVRLDRGVDIAIACPGPRNDAGFGLVTFAGRLPFVNSTLV